MKMDSEQLQELAQLYATEGLEGHQLARFEEWQASATAEEKAEFAAVVDALALLTLATVPEETPAPGGKARLLRAIAGGEAVPAADALPVPEAFTFLAKDQGTWVKLPVPGVRVKELSAHQEDGMTMFLLEMDAGARLPSHHHHGAEMAYVLEGDLVTEGRTLRAGDFMRSAAETEHSQPYSPSGCRALIVTASENFPRRTVGVMRRLQDVFVAVRDLVGGGK